MHVPIQEAEELKDIVSKLEKENEEIQLRFHHVTFERNATKSLKIPNKEMVSRRIFRI